MIDFIELNYYTEVLFYVYIKVETCYLMIAIYDLNFPSNYNFIHMCFVYVFNNYE